MKRSNLAAAVALGSSVLVSGCASMASFKEGASEFGTAVSESAGKIGGAILGAGIGYLACDGDPRCIVAGAFVGTVLGEVYDQRQEQLRRLAEEKNIDLETRTVKTFNFEADSENALELAINEGGMFEVGSDRLKTKARMDLMSIAVIYRQQTDASPEKQKVLDNSKILIIGHSDATGSEAYNRQLSERRAHTVAKLFAEVGVPSDRLYFQGAGESQPVATNDTPEGRSANRRVEIVEIDSEPSLAAYNLQRQNDRKYLAHSNRTAEEKADIRKRVKPEPEQVSQPAVAASKPAPEPKSAPVSAPTPSPSSVALLDFGGAPASADFSRIQQAAGSTKSDSGIPLFSKAFADDQVSLSPCYMEAPRVTGDIQNLATGKKLDASELDMADLWPGLNGSVWYDGSVNGHGIGYDGLVVAKGAGIPKGRPTVKIYENVQADLAPDYVSEPHIESYPGEKGLLLRTYFEENHPVACMDVVMAKTASPSTKAAVLYYAAGDTIYEKNIELKRIK
ncbi:OmpA family protein [Marinobacter sp. F4216]|uniref:OmpA family protein n=1 Tax=Marinobacter sp. F4216 TaxID=2874281 RepID=UPI001CBC60C5|nr:OmpA family protein [Marinobacter sp. F4216]MBZ2169471.1 OmpA family protein [Marinobacter sp. F4216]